MFTKLESPKSRVILIHVYHLFTIFLPQGAT